MRRLIVALGLLVALGGMAQETAPPHEPTVAELKLQIAELRELLIQSQSNLVQCQYPQAEAEKQAAQAEVFREHSKPALKPEAGKKEKPPEAK